MGSDKDKHIAVEISASKEQKSSQPPRDWVGSMLNILTSVCSLLCLVSPAHIPICPQCLPLPHRASCEVLSWWEISNFAIHVGGILPGYRSGTQAPGEWVRLEIDFVQLYKAMV